MPVSPDYRIINFLSGNNLNRLSWKRPDSQFINNCLKNNSLWILFSNGQPLVRAVDGRGSSLAYLPLDRVRHLLGCEPYFGQCETTGIVAASDVAQLESSRLVKPRIVFLGSSSPEKTAAHEVKDMIERNATDKYTSYFSLDIAGQASPDDVDLLLQASTSKEETLLFVETRAALTTFSAFDAGLFAQARSIVDWNSRNQFCPACGQPSYSLWAGWKLACTTALPWGKGHNSPNICPSSKGLHNFMHPRTDAVIIVAVISQDGERILLGRNKRSPLGMYSVLAGFLEPGESLESAVQREIMEESGVMVKNVQYHSTQPWPFPANFMIGCFAIAEDENIHLLDSELEDVKFFSKKEVQDALGHPQDTIRRPENMGFGGESHTPASAEAKPGSIFRVSPLISIAGVLISEWASGRVPFSSNL